jgi:hypothetical protein
MDDSFVAECADHARRLVEGRAIVIGGLPLAGATRLVRRVRELGAARCFVVATGVGTGPLPGTAEAESIVVPIAASNISEEMRLVERTLTDPPPDVLAALDAFDPDRTALVLLALVEPMRAIGSRVAYGARRAEWVALEDKTLADELFDATGVARPPSQIVPTERSALHAAARALDRGAGTVWVGDAREGFNGGGTHVRWIRGDDDGRDAAEFFASQCDHVRVAPFVEGISCSVHGFVTDDGTAVFRPVELVNLRRPGHDRFLYAGCATFWDPSASDREAMRAAARRLGSCLRERVGYRGPFTLDGILGSDGFVATECNPRWGAGLTCFRAVLPELSFELLAYQAAAGDAGWLRAADLERVVTAAGDRVRDGGGWTSIATPVDATRVEDLVHTENGFRVEAGGEPAHGRLTIGPGAMGGFVRVEFDPEHVPKGPSVGPLVVDAFAYADRVHDAGLGELVAATAVR